MVIMMVMVTIMAMVADDVDDVSGLTKSTINSMFKQEECKLVYAPASRLPVGCCTCCSCVLRVQAMRANFIFMPYGHLYLPALPRPLPITVAVGEPIKVPVVASPTKAQVHTVARLYFTQLGDMFDEYKGQVSGWSRLFVVVVVVIEKKRILLQPCSVV